MLEIEVKYRCDDFAPIEAKLSSWGARETERRDDSDAYFNAPHRDFARTDEALRVRRIGSRNLVTYKGPKTDPHTKTRREIEVPLADGPDADADVQQLLMALGFKPTAVVKKRRRVYEFARDGFEVQACLDELDGIGRFVELEIVADESALEPAKTVVLNCAAELGLSQQERRSYLELLLESQGR